MTFLIRLTWSHDPTLHYGKLSVTRWTFISGAKISTFVEISGLFDQVERVLDIYFTEFSVRKAYGAIRDN